MSERELLFQAAKILDDLFVNQGLFLAKNPVPAFAFLAEIHKRYPDLLSNEMRYILTPREKN
jgi:hypothetical protein